MLIFNKGLFNLLFRVYTIFVCLSTGVLSLYILMSTPKSKRQEQFFKNASLHGYKITSAKAKGIVTKQIYLNTYEESSGSLEHI